MPELFQKDIGRHLIDAGFTPLFKDREDPASQAYVKEINGSEVEIEFLTDNAVRSDKEKNVAVAGIVAQPLSYLQLSFKNTLEFQTHSGEIGWVVSPEAWIFHKGLTFPKRSDKIKIYKDLYGIWYASAQLQMLSEEAIAGLKVLAHKFPSWFKSFQRNLGEWVEHAAPADWLKLEAQDPFGALKKQSFQRLVERLSSR